MPQRPIIVGLGNPGAEYEWTRHNIGFIVVDEIARRSGATVKSRMCRALVGKAELGGGVCQLVKPQTFMNLSGESVACLLAKTEPRQTPDSVLVISDDLALPFGKIRIRRNGSAGGHNGLKSIIVALDTDGFLRLRVGIMPDHPVGDTKRFVLDSFSVSERKGLDEVVEHATQAVSMILLDGVDKAMAAFN